MDGGNLRLQDRVYQPMTCKHSLFLELRRNDNRLERLSTASCAPKIPSQRNSLTHVERIRGGKEEGSVI